MTNAVVSSTGPAPCAAAGGTATGRSKTAAASVPAVLLTTNRNGTPAEGPIRHCLARAASLESVPCPENAFSSMAPRSISRPVTPSSWRCSATGGTRPEGACLCLGGDCPHCLASVDGVGYVRTCQIEARPGTVVETHHRDGGRPPLTRPVDDDDAPPATSCPSPVARHVHCDVAVLGQGASGQAAAADARAAGKSVVTLDAADGQEVIGLYAGPLVVARTREGTLNVHPRDEIVVATGAAEIQPVVPGSDLGGLVTARAASALAQSGVDLGRLVAVGEPPSDIDCIHAEGDLVRFEGEERVRAVVVRDTTGRERELHLQHRVAGVWDSIPGTRWRAWGAICRFGSSVTPLGTPTSRRALAPGPSVRATA